MGRKIKAGQPADVKPAKPVHQAVTVSFRHVQPGKNFCLSLCHRDALKEIADCLRMLTTLTWQQVMESGGKGRNKAGLGYTPYADDVLRHVQRPQDLSPDIRIAGVRFSQKGRVFGGYHDRVFYLLWFDPEHDIVKA